MGLGSGKMGSGGLSLGRVGLNWMGWEWDGVASVWLCLEFYGVLRYAAPFNAARNTKRQVGPIVLYLIGGGGVGGLVWLGCIHKRFLCFRTCWNLVKKHLNFFSSRPFSSSLIKTPQSRPRSWPA